MSELSEVSYKCRRLIEEQTNCTFIPASNDSRSWDVITDGQVIIGLIPLAINLDLSNSPGLVLGWSVAHYAGGYWHATPMWLTGSLEDVIGRLERMKEQSTGEEKHCHGRTE